MLRAQKTNRCNTIGDSARHSTADSASTAATPLSPFLYRPLSRRHAQPLHSKPLTTTVAKNALGDTHQSATECPTRHPLFGRVTTHSAQDVGRRLLHQLAPRQSASYSSPAYL